VAYVAEAPPPTRTPEWGGAPPGADGKRVEGAAAPKGWRGQGEWAEDWGELNTGEGGWAWGAALPCTKKATGLRALRARLPSFFGRAVASLSFAGKRPPTLFVLDCEEGGVHPVPGLPSDCSCGQPAWAPGGEALLRGWLCAHAVPRLAARRALRTLPAARAPVPVPTALCQRRDVPASLAQASAHSRPRGPPPPPPAPAG
jgi:hypothetical protein